MRRSSGPPAWLVFLVAIALVFGAYYLWTGLSTYLRTGGLGVVEATERAQIVATATAEEFFADNPRPTARPSQTPVPECQAFVVTVPSAIVRETPSTSGAIVTSLAQGSDVCVLQKEGEWYAIDTNPRSRRLDLAYMHESIIEAVNPTPTPSRTPSPLPTVTVTPTLTPSQTFTPAPTDTADPDATDTLTPTRTSTPTPSFQSA